MQDKSHSSDTRRNLQGLLGTIADASSSAVSEIGLERHALVAVLVQQVIRCSGTPSWRNYRIIGVSEQGCIEAAGCHARLRACASAENTGLGDR